MIKKLKNQPYAPKWEQRGRKKILALIGNYEGEEPVICFVTSATSKHSMYLLFLL
jgi:hypothetical protein